MQNMTQEVLGELLRKSSSACSELSLECAECPGRYSANPWDYFLQKDDYVIRCFTCGKPMVLVEKRYAYVNQQPYEVGGYFATIAFDVCISLEATRGAMFRWSERRDQELRKTGSVR